MKWKDRDHTRENCYVQLKLDNGQEIIHSASRFVSTNCYLLYKGNKGQPGGYGGLNGLGGQGGFKGECIAISKQNKPFRVNIQAIEGCDGQDGKPGRTGKYGKNGWDVGYTDFQLWPQPQEFGTSQDRSLTIDYSTDNSDRVYCGYHYDALHSRRCYATMKESTLKHRKLTEREKLRGTSENRRRRQEATATRKAAMQRSAMEKMYGECFEKSNNFFNKISQMGAEVTANIDILQRKTKFALDEVEKLKERSREKVSRYQIYKAENKVEKVDANSKVENNTSRQEQKSKILSEIENNTVEHINWDNLFKVELSKDELRSVQEKWDSYQTNQEIITPEVQRIQQKLALAKFQNIDRNDYSLPTNDEIIQHSDFNAEKYLKICEESNSSLRQILEFQDETDRKEKIHNAFVDLRQYLLSTNELNMVKEVYKDLASVKIDNENLEEFMESINTDNEENLKKKCDKLSILCNDSNEWKKVSAVLNSSKKSGNSIEQLKDLRSMYNENLLKNGKDLFQYLFVLLNKLCSLETANSTLAKLVELVVIDGEECKNEHGRCREYALLSIYKDFLHKKQKRAEKILETFQFLSQRSLKAKWLKFHEYPNFFVTESVREVSERRSQDIDEKLLQKLYNLYLANQNETMDWHKYIDNEILNICLDKIKFNQSNCYVPFLELFSWKHDLNVKFYKQNDSKQFECIHEHSNIGKQVEHVLLRKDGTTEHLVSDQNFLELLITRRKLIAECQLERQSETYFPSNDTENWNDI